MEGYYIAPTVFGSTTLLHAGRSSIGRYNSWAFLSYHRPIKALSNSENELESLTMSFALTSSSSNSTSLEKPKHHMSERNSILRLFVAHPDSTSALGVSKLMSNSKWSREARISWIIAFFKAFRSSVSSDKRQRLFAGLKRSSSRQRL